MWQLLKGQVRSGQILLDLGKLLDFTMAIYHSYMAAHPKIPIFHRPTSFWRGWGLEGVDRDRQYWVK